MSFQTRRKKLYFSVVNMSRGGIGSVIGLGKVFPCTAFRATYTGDDYASVLHDFSAVLGAANPPEQFAERDVSAWFQVQRQNWTNVANGGTHGPVYFLTDFIGVTNGMIANGDILAGSVITPVQGVDFGAGRASIPTGASPVATRHFAVRVRPVKLTTVGANFTVGGRLYVQRQHSIEV